MAELIELNAEFLGYVDKANQIKEKDSVVACHLCDEARKTYHALTKVVYNHPKGQLKLLNKLEQEIGLDMTQA